MNEVYRCLLVDDVADEVTMLEQLLSKIAGFQVVYTTTDPLQARDYLLGQSVDVVFADIDMPNLSGLELAQLCKGKAQFVLCTGYRQYAAESYEHDVTDYLIKPVTLVRLIKAVEKVRQKRQPPPSHIVSEEACIFVKTDRETLVKLHIAEIIYVESEDNYVYYYTAQQKIMTRATLQSVVQQLAAHHFVRIQKSYLVCLASVIKVEQWQVWVRLADGQKQALPLGNSYKEAFLEALQQWKKI